MDGVVEEDGEGTDEDEIDQVVIFRASLLDDIDNDLLECLDIFEDAKGMIIPAIVVSCL